MFRYVPAGDGVVTVASDDPFLSENVDMTLNEHSDNVMILTALLHKTGKPLIVETVTVMDNLRRVRTVQVRCDNCRASSSGLVLSSFPVLGATFAGSQRFDATGQFQCMYLIRENRVIDSVSGAMEKYDE